MEEEEDADLGGIEAGIFVQAEEAETASANSVRLSMMVVVGDVDRSSWGEALERFVMIAAAAAGGGGGCVLWIVRIGYRVLTPMILWKMGEENISRKEEQGHLVIES